jgi:hypothetical protein
MRVLSWNSALPGFSKLRLKPEPAYCLVLLLALCTAACRQDMHDQPNYQPLERSDFFGDGQASRPLIAGAVSATTSTAPRVMGRPGSATA